MVEYSTVEYVAGALTIFFTTISFLGSVLSLYLIHTLHHWNGYILLVYSLSLFQALYDFSYYMVVSVESSIPHILPAYEFINGFSGLAVTFWTNVICGMLLYTTVYLKSFDVKRHFFLLHFVILFLSLSYSTITIAMYPSNLYTMNWLYFWLRIGSIAFNIVTLLVVNHILRTSDSLCYQLGNCCMSKQSSNLRLETNGLLCELFRRMKYYPIVQIITRAGASWWDYKYGYGTSNFTQGPYPVEKQVSLYMFVITNCLAGFGFFLVLLWVQPALYTNFRVLCSYVWRCGCIFTRDHNDRLFSDDSSAITRASVFLSSTKSNSSGNKPSLSYITTGNKSMALLEDFLPQTTPTVDLNGETPLLADEYNGVDEDILWERLRAKVISIVECSAGPANPDQL